MESVVRGLVVYFFVLVVFRISGKRTLAETSSFDLVLLLIISETTQQAMVGQDHSLTNAVLLIVTLVGSDVLLSIVKRYSPGIERWLDGLPVVIVEQGRPRQAIMRRERVDMDDVLEAGRLLHGLESLEQIEFAVLERGGKISIVPRPTAFTPSKR